jgi:hypothetical protein
MASTIAAGLAYADLGQKPSAEGIEHDFGGKVLLVVTRPKDGRTEVGGGPVEQAKVRRLGDYYFIVGKVPDLGEMFKESKGTVLWTPLSEVIQITEYDTIDAIKKVYAEFDGTRRGK